MRGLARLSCLALLIFGAAQSAVAAEPLRVARLDGPAPRIDAQLDDEAWQAVPPVTAFFQSEPSAGTPAMQRTELRLLHDGTLLYVAVRAHAAEPARIVANTLRRDADAIASGDHLTLVLDPRGSGRNGFLFRVNPLGARQDGLVYDGGHVGLEWDAQWDAAARIDETGWVAEFAIPLSSLAAPADGRPWGFNVERFSAASGERVRLHAPQAEVDIGSLTHAGALAGISAERSGWGLRLQPGLRWQTQRAAGEARTRALEPSLDAFYQVTPGVTATLTLNTDFSDTELDERVVHLSRFELFRAEKRAFFNQDSGRFTFGGLYGDEPQLLPFFSRRVGLNESLDAGLKVSGSAGPVEFGVFGAQVERGDAVRSPRVGVVRAAASLDGGHRVGVIGTQGNPEGTSGSHLGGLDYQFRHGNIRGRSVDAHVWALQSSNDGVGKGGAQGASLSLPCVGLHGELAWQRVDDHFLPALGYLQEAGVSKQRVKLGWWHRSESGGNVIPAVYAKERRRLDGTERSSVRGGWVEFSNARGDEIVPEAYVEHDEIAVPFELLPGVTVPAGRHDFHYAIVTFGLSASRLLSGAVTVRSGGYYARGRLDEQHLSAAWRPSAHWAFTGSHTRQDVRLPTGRFAARSSSLALEHAASTRSAQSVVLQHDNVSGLTGLGVRASWVWVPGREWRFAFDRVRPTPAAGELQSRATVSLVWAWER